MRSTARSTLDECRACGGIGFQKLDRKPGEPGFGELVPCEECGQARQAEYLKRLSRLRGDLATASLEHWTSLPGVQRVLPDIIGYITKSGRGDDRKATGWITLSGPPGTGKTHLLAALVNHYADAGRPAVYITMQELLRELRDSYRPDSTVIFSQLWTDITERATVLAIDEVEKFSGTPWAQEQVFALLNQRHDERSKGLTLLATNVNLRGDDASLLPDGGWDAHYLLSRIKDGRNLLLTEFWQAADVRPALEIL